MPKRSTTPRDATGRKRDQLQKEHAEELQRRESEIGLATASQREASEEVVDLTGQGGATEDADQRWRFNQPGGPLTVTRQPGQGGAGSIDADGYMTVDAATGTPTISSVTTAGTGGTLPASTTHGYKVTAVDDATGQESGPSGEATVTTGAATATSANTVNWGAVTGAERYRVYGRTAGGPWVRMAEVTGTSWTDTGAAIPANAAAVPSARGVGRTAIKTNSTPVTGTGTEGPSAIPGGTIADGRVRATVDTRNAQNVGTVGGPDVEAPQIWTVGNPNEPQEVAGGVRTLERDETRVIRVNTTLEQVTIGAGTSYDFVEGQQYRVPGHVADYLEELGYIWH